MAQGHEEGFTIDGSEVVYNDSIGPSIYAYLNSPSFVNGGEVNSTPYFYAQITDKDGINASGNGIGHDMQLTIDGKLTQTYILNDNFRYDSVVIPQEQQVSVYQSSLRVHTRYSSVHGTYRTILQPSHFSSKLSRDWHQKSIVSMPLRTQLRQRQPLSSPHNYIGSDVDIDIEVFDM